MPNFSQLPLFFYLTDNMSTAIESEMFTTSCPFTVSMGYTYDVPYKAAATYLGVFPVPTQPARVCICNRFPDRLQDSGCGYHLKSTPTAKWANCWLPANSWRHLPS